MGALAEGAEQHHRHRTVVHHGEHGQAVAGLVDEAGLGDLDVPRRVAHQRVGVVEAQHVVGFLEGGALARGGAQLADQRVLPGGLEQAYQVAGGGDVAFRQAGRLDEAGAGHAQHLGLGVHRRDEAPVPARVVVREGGGGAVLRRHQRQAQHLLAADVAADPHPRVDAAQLVGVADGHRDDFVHRQLGVEGHHGGHQLADRGDRHHRVRMAGEQHLVAVQIDHQGAAGGQLQTGRVTGGTAIGSPDIRGQGNACA
ncbi:hypothetical protein D3C78_789530 [compost metagenome]